MVETKSREQKQNLKEQVKKITEKLEQGIRELYCSESYQNYLKVMSRFHHYSINNSVLIAMQMPNATYVAGYHAWQNQFGRQVLKGQKGIRILAPVPYTKKKQKSDSEEDQDTKTEETEQRLAGFRVVSVFDISQTEGKELPHFGISNLPGDVLDYEKFIRILIECCPVPITFEEHLGGAKGCFYRGENRIAVLANMSEVHTVKTLIHEMAHEKMHANHGVEEKSDQIDRNTKEVEAESVAYTVCQHFGIDTGEYSFGYIASWSRGKELTQLKESLGRIRCNAAEMIDLIEQRFLSLEKQRPSLLEKLAKNETKQKYQISHENMNQERQR